MKPIAAVPPKLAASITMGIVGVIGVAYAASFVVTDYTPHKFAHMDAPLWTDKPVAIDRNEQALERLPALLASADVPAQEHPLGGEIASAANAVPPQQSTSRNEQASFETNDPMMPETDARTVSAETDGTIELTSAHIDWCFARYRSYRIEDNSYQPFDASERQQCQSPHDNSIPIADAASMDNDELPTGIMPQETAAVEEPQMIAASDSVDTAWCFAQYRSYRAEDNTYQPYDGGPRRQCVPRESSY